MLSHVYHVNKLDIYIQISKIAFLTKIFVQFCNYHSKSSTSSFNHSRKAVSIFLFNSGFDVSSFISVKPFCSIFFQLFTIFPLKFFSILSISLNSLSFCHLIRQSVSYIFYLGILRTIFTRLFFSHFSVICFQLTILRAADCKFYPSLYL